MGSGRRRGRSRVAEVLLAALGGGGRRLDEDLERRAGRQVRDRDRLELSWGDHVTREDTGLEKDQLRLAGRGDGGPGGDDKHQAAEHRGCGDQSIPSPPDGHGLTIAAPTPADNRFLGFDTRRVSDLALDEAVSPRASSQLRNVEYEI